MGAAPHGCCATWIMPHMAPRTRATWGQHSSSAPTPHLGCAAQRAAPQLRCVRTAWRHTARRQLAAAAHTARGPHHGRLHSWLRGSCTRSTGPHHGGFRHWRPHTYVCGPCMAPDDWSTASAFTSQQLKHWGEHWAQWQHACAVGGSWASCPGLACALANGACGWYPESRCAFVGGRYARLLYWWCVKGDVMQ
jgi:hypothetical protein